MNTRVLVFSTGEAMSRWAARHLVEIIISAVRDRGRFTVALSGGTTPQVLYRILSGEFSGRIPWDHVHLYWGDERYVPQRDRRSNFRLIHEAILHYVHIPLDNIHPMPTHRSDPHDAADDYEAFMRTQFHGGFPRFDAVLLGMGADGHTASLFPRSPALAERERWVIAVDDAPAEPSVRLTLTLPVFNAAAHVLFLISGAEKAAALASVLTPDPGAPAPPAAHIQPSHGELVWCVDEGAAQQLPDHPLSGVDIERGPEDLSQ